MLKGGRPNSKGSLDVRTSFINLAKQFQCQAREWPCAFEVSRILSDKRIVYLRQYITQYMIPGKWLSEQK